MIETCPQCLGERVMLRIALPVDERPADWDVMTDLWAPCAMCSGHGFIGGDPAPSQPATRPVLPYWAAIGLGLGAVFATSAGGMIIGGWALGLIHGACR